MQNIAPVHWFRRGLALAYFTAFVSLATQIVGLIGARGILPAAVYLSRAREYFGAGVFHNIPTLFWFGVSDTRLIVVCLLGAACAVWLASGYFPRAAAAACYVLWLSLVSVGQDFLSFQWDYLLLECGFLAIFLRGAGIAVLLYRWLLFRFMLFSGLVKLASGDAAWRSMAALTYHYQTQPLPTPLAWYAHQLPARLHQFSALLMFAIEIIAPFLLFGPRRWRLRGGACIVFLQLLILLTGNYTFFNLLTIALCLLLWQEAGIGQSTLTRVLAATLVLLGLMLGVQSVFHVMPQPVAAVEGWLAPFGIVNSYGLFAVMTTVRNEIIVEGSNDGADWSAYEFRFKPGDVRRPPRWVAPHQPRLDWQMWFAALGNFRGNPWFVNFAARLLEGSREVRALLASDPFAGSAPRYVRALVYEYRFTNWAERRATGDWWKRELRGTYLPPIEKRMLQERP